ncbi:MAG TPA: hypothetical protein VMC79_06735, partial [Rectinemataceae bacterium]|nr:hypothetical protein [Rectinemataceae bacterium]
MKLRLLCLALLVGTAAFAWAQQQAEVVNYEGDVSRKTSAGKITGIDFGDKLLTGDSVITKAGSTAELKLLVGASSIKIRQNTVFVLGSTSVGGTQKTVLQTVVGSVAMKFDKLGDKEPLLATTSCSAGVRGTEVEIYGGMDGSSLVAVVSGAVELQAGGQTVDLATNEAVQIQPGLPPGQKFAWIGKELDFSTWDKGNLDSYLADPVASALKVEQQLKSYRDSMEALIPQLAELKAANQAAYVELKKLVDAKEDAKAKEFNDNTMFPMMKA